MHFISKFYPNYLIYIAYRHKQESYICTKAYNMYVEMPTKIINEELSMVELVVENNELNGSGNAGGSCHN